MWKRGEVTRDFIDDDDLTLGHSEKVSGGQEMGSEKGIKYIV